MSLFPTNVTKPKAKPPLIDRAQPVRIPTGVPRLVESSSRRARSQQDAWSELLDAIRRSSAARLELLKGRSNSDRVACPWERLMSCDASCRCGGAATVTISFLRKHYERLVVELVLITQPMHRSSP